MKYFTREEMYELAWSKPMTQLAGEFDLTGNGLKKVFAKYAVSVPPTGYWAKVGAGKTATKMKLPPREPGAPWLWEFGKSAGYRWPVDPQAELAEPEYPEPIFDEPIESVEARVRNSIGRVRVVASLELAHPEMKRLLEKDQSELKRAGSTRFCPATTNHSLLPRLKFAVLRYSTAFLSVWRR